jgi:hypothetical protein
MIARAAKKVIIYDPLFEHGMLGVTASNVDDVAQFDRCVFQPIKNDDEVFEKFCQTVWERRENVIVIIDEVDEHATVYNLPPNFGKLVRLGRHKGIGIVGITRRIANVNKTLPALSNHIISFRQTLPNDVAYLADFIGWENAAKLKDMPDFTYLHYDWKVATIGKTHKDKEQPQQERESEKSAEKKVPGQIGSINKLNSVQKNTDKTQQIEPQNSGIPKEKPHNSLFGGTDSFKYPRTPFIKQRKKPQTGLF